MAFIDWNDFNQKLWDCFNGVCESGCGEEPCGVTNPQAYYRMDEAGDGEPDWTPSGFDLTEFGSVGSSAGVVGAAREVETVDDSDGEPNNYLYRASPTESLFSLQQGPKTFAGWIKSESTNAIVSNNQSIGKGSLAVGTEWNAAHMYIGIPANSINGVSFSVRSDAYDIGGGSIGEYIAASDLTPPSVLSKGDWTFIALRHDGAENFRFTLGLTNGSIGHKDGVDDGFWAGPAASDPDLELIFGGYYPDDEVCHYDEWGFWECYLSDEDIEWIFNGGAGRQVV